MRPLLSFPVVKGVDFIGLRNYAFAFSIATILATAALLGLKGLNLGIDFSGGILIEARAAAPVDLGALRARTAELGMGEVALTSIDRPTDIVLRVERQPGGDAAQQAAIGKVIALLGPSFEIRRQDVVGPTVGDELLESGIIATVLGIVAIGIYVGFRFEWQFGVAALIATFHDAITVFGFYALLGLDFNMTSIAAILTIIGYSINDTVVVFDRIRENLRKYKQMPIPDLINQSTNETLSRTIMTSVATATGVLALLLFGGDSVNGFAAAMMWGIAIGTFSSIYVASALLLLMPSLRINERRREARAAEPQQP